jgi:hypothetical protein
MKVRIGWLVQIAAFTVCTFVVPAATEAGGYVYRPRSLYIVPPTYYYGPVLTPTPIVVVRPLVPPPVVVYEPVAPVIVAPSAAVGYYSASPGIPVRVRERGWSSPFHARYKYEVKFPDGLEYEYRYRRNGLHAWSSIRWDD